MSSQDVGQAIGTLIGVVMVIGLFWVVPITAGIRTAQRKNRSPHWMWFGIHPLSGWIAYLVLASVRPLKECPSCAERTAGHAKLCPFCGHRFNALSDHPEATSLNPNAVTASSITN